jgi:Rho GTPase-activating protein 19
MNASLSLFFQSYFPAYTQIAEICNSKENDEKERIKNSLQLIFLLLPSENKTTLEKLVNLLYKASCMEAHNKMNSDTLATLFTPHLVCPRKLQPESLHQMAATMTRMISFMIANAQTIFLVPEKLATDIKAYFAEEKRRRETPEKVLDESIQSDSVASTVFTFVDRQKTAEENVQSTTDQALAALFAHIQSLPESSKKKKLIKQFNKQNGQGKRCFI